MIFLKRFGTLYDLLIDLLSEKISPTKTLIEQNEMIKKIEKLRDFVLLKKEKINKEKNKTTMKKAKTMTQKNILSQKSVTINALRMYDKRGAIIDAFIKKKFAWRFRKRCLSGRRIKIRKKHSRKNKREKTKSTISKRIKNINSTTNAQ